MSIYLRIDTDKYNKLTSITAEGSLFTMSYGVQSGGVHFWSKDDFLKYMYKNDSVDLFYQLQSEIGQFLLNKFNQQHLKLDQQLINITDCEVDRIVEKYKSNHPIICYYFNEVLK